MSEFKDKDVIIDLGERRCFASIDKAHQAVKELDFKKGARGTVTLERNLADARECPPDKILQYDENGRKRFVDPPVWIGLDLAADPRPVDCSAGDRPRVIISDTTAILLAEAFCEMANARRLYVTGIEGAENFTRAFGELELLKKAVEK